MTGPQFDALVKLKRGKPESPGNRAARLVLVNGVSAPDAVRATGASRSTVYKAVDSYWESHKLMQTLYGSPPETCS